MSADRAGGGVESVEDQQPVDRPPPPPPPDNPGAEPEGVASRADSRAAAAAANKSAESQPSTPTDSPASASRDPNQVAGLSREAPREHTASDEQPSSQDVDPESLEGPGATDSSAGQPSTLTKSPTDDTLVDDDWPSAQAATTPETVDHVEETPAPPRAENPGLFDDPGNEPGGASSRGDTGAGAAANGELAEKQAAADNTDGPPAPAPELESTSADAHPGINDQLNETPKPESERQTADEWPWAEEFAARAEARENAATANTEQTDEALADSNAATGSPEATDAILALRAAVVSREKSTEPSAEDASGTTDVDLSESLIQSIDPSEQTRPGDGAEATAAVEKDGHPDLLLTVDGKLVNEYIDPAGASARGDSDRERPAVEETAGIEDKEKSRPERLRKKFFEVVEDAHDITSKAAKKGQEIFGRPPTGQPETRTSQEVAAAPHEGVKASDAATAVLVTGIVFGELIRWGHGKLKAKKER